MDLKKPRDKTTIRILLVDDNEDLRAVLRMILTRLGYLGTNITEAGDGLQALMRIVSGLEVDIILTDMDMPEMTGPELARQLADRGNSTPVVLITGNRNEAPSAGNNLKMIVDKPVSDMALDMAVDLALARVENAPTRISI